MFAEQKKKLRAEMKAKLAALSVDERRSKSDAILARVVKQKSYKKARTVMAYASFGTEVETGKLLERILLDGKRLVLPRLNPFDNSLVPHLIEDLAKDLTLNKFGFQEPYPNRPVVPLKTVDWIVVPGLAFDEFGNRLGRGLGCYDKLIFEAPPKTRAVGLAFELQLLSEMDLPLDVNDMPIDLILTESRRIDPNKALDAFYEDNKEFVDNFGKALAEEFGDEPD